MIYSRNRTNKIKFIISKLEWTMPFSMVGLENRDHEQWCRLQMCDNRMIYEGIESPNMHTQSEIISNLYICIQQLGVLTMMWQMNSQWGYIGLAICI